MARSEAAVRRIEGILDAGSFMEMGGQVLACDTTVDSRDAQRSDGVITGYGTVDGRPVYVYSQDPGVLGGSIAEMHIEKILRLYEMALRSGTPVIALLDSAGLRISEGAGALDAYGRLYRTMAQAKGIIPQIAGAFGPCGGGCAFIAAMCDFLYTADDAAVFVNPKDARREENGPCLTKAKSSAYPAGEQLRHGSGTEEQVCDAIRRLIGYVPLTSDDPAPDTDSTDDPNRSCTSLAAGNQDIQAIIEEIADFGSALPIQSPAGGDVSICFARFNGRVTGVLGQSSGGRLSAEVCESMADFVDFCSLFGLPVLTLTDTEGFSTESCQEAKLPQAVAYLLSAFAQSDVPKVNVITGQATGSAYCAMNSRGLGADFVFAWDGARVQVMPAQDAVRILNSDELARAEDKSVFLAEKAAEYERKAGTEAFLARGYIDKIIAPVDTRKYVIGALEMLSDKRGM